jgi:hypothetical protein
MAAAGVFSMTFSALLLLIGLSLIETDWQQSQPILAHTAARPHITAAGHRVWEGNSEVAGDIEAAARLTEFMRRVHEVAPPWLGAALTAGRAYTVLSNDRVLGQVGLPRCIAISHRWRW